MDIKWTLYRKISLLIILILVINFIAVELALFSYVGKRTADRFVENVGETTELLTMNINQIFDDATQLLNLITKDIERDLQQGEPIETTIEGVVLTHEEIMNVYAAYPDGSVDIFPPAVIPEGFDHTTRSWYVSAVVADRVVWTSPYEDIATGELVITGSKGFDFGERRAVVGMDITLKKLNAMIKDLYLGKDGWIGILETDGSFVASSEDSFSGKKLDEVNDEGLSDLEPITGRYITSQGVYFFRRLDYGNLRLVVHITDEDISGARVQAQTLMSLLTTAILAFGIIISQIITRRVTKPLEQLKNTLIASYEEGDMIMMEEGTDDEVNTLIAAYNNLADNINNQQATIIKMAFTDELTGLANRNQFDQLMVEAVAKNHQIAYFYLDIDNFKYINDTYGHSTGDMVLIQLGSILKDCCEGMAILARISGDEFGIGVMDYGSETDLIETAYRIMEKVKVPIEIHRIEFRLTASIGISRYPEDASSYPELLANADVAMYRAKTNAKDGFVIFNEEIHKAFINEMSVEIKLVQAIEEGIPYPVFQPVVDVNENRIAGFEALARWEDEVLGPVYPDVFIPIAERNLTINKLGYLILERAIAFAKNLYESYGSYYEMNVNVSVIQLKNEGFINDVMELLKRYDYPPKFLNLEITESITLESSEEIMMKLAYLRKKEIKISLDDFGTGYSSLGHLTDLSLSHIKIDRALILKAKQSEEVFQLMKGIVEFAHTMGYKVVAEGIEEKEMEAMVIAMKADYGQGYMYARPMNEQDIHHLLGIR